MASREEERGRKREAGKENEEGIRKKGVMSDDMRRWGIGTWNVRTMNEKGKLENVKMEMKRYGLSVLGLSEVRWKGQGDFVSGDVRVIYSGGSEGQRGVAVLLKKEAAGC